MPVLPCLYICIYSAFYIWLIISCSLVSISQSKANVVQTKMDLIRHLQVQLGTERQTLSQVEQQGERLGQQVHTHTQSRPVL